MESNLFLTSDGDLAAYLYSRAYPLLSICEMGALTAYAFPCDAALSAEAYYAGASVPAKNLLQAAHQLWRHERHAARVA